MNGPTICFWGSPSGARFAGRMFALMEAGALAYGEIMGDTARSGAPMSAPDGMIAAIARVNRGRLATRNLSDFRTTGLDLTLGVPI
jgi:predicted nucleic acid-binding protein